MAVKILLSEQIREVDARTIAQEQITSLCLMERAASACLEAFLPHTDPSKPVHVFCGPGNNGGDGFVLARLLTEMHFEVHTWLVPFTQMTPECETNRKRSTTCVELTETARLPQLSTDCVVVDALLGAGASHAPEGMLKQVVELINGSGAKVLSVDVPSGLPTDSIPAWKTVVHADFTATFQQPKLTFFLKETACYVNNWTVVDIGLDKTAIAEQPGLYFYLDDVSVKTAVKTRERFSHKGTYGHGLLFAGSKGKMGAAVLSAGAALRSGIGLLTVHVPSSGLSVLQTAVPEAMCIADPSDEHLSVLNAAPGDYSAIGMGPGIGIDEDTLAVVRKVIAGHGKMVIDADALNLLAANPDLLEHLPEETVLTPHPKEFERLAGVSVSGIERLGRLTAFAQKYRCTVILKDAITAIATKSGAVFFNTTGNPGMATGGSGDVLTGIVLGLLAQGYPAETAAQIAVYFHGKAGDTAAAKRGQAALIARDLIEELRIDC